MATIVQPQRAVSQNRFSLMDMVLAMQSAEERRKTRKLQKRELAIKEEALGVSKEQVATEKARIEEERRQFDALAPLREATEAYNLSLVKLNEANIDKARIEYEEYISKEQKEARRAAAVAATTGDKVAKLEAEQRIKDIEEKARIYNLMSDDEKKWAMFASQLAEKNRAETDALRRENDANVARARLFEAQLSASLASLNAQKTQSEIEKNTLLGFNDNGLRLKAANALQRGDYAEVQRLAVEDAALMQRTRGEEQVGKETLAQLTAPQAVPGRWVGEEQKIAYSDTARSLFEVAVASGRPITAELRLVDISSAKKKPDFKFGFGGVPEKMILTYQDAVNMGIEEEWYNSQVVYSGSAGERPVPGEKRSTPKGDPLGLLETPPAAKPKAKEKNQKRTDFSKQVPSLLP